MSLLVMILFPGCAVFFMIWGIIEAMCLKKDMVTLGNDGSPDKIRILFITDLHAEFCFIPARRLIRILREEKPDVVVFGGDMINNPRFFKLGRKYLQKIAAACREENVPFIGVTGNHDVEIPAEDIKSCGFYLLSESCFDFVTKLGNKVSFTGVNDSGRYNRVWYEPSRPSSDAACVIMVAHNPDTLFFFPENTRYDHLIAGHIHGGQIRTPFGIEFSVLRNDLLPKQGVIAGHHTVSGKSLFISKGVGCVGLPFRFFSRPEVNVIDVRFGPVTEDGV